jgi:transcription antitermination factor NusG
MENSLNRAFSETLNIPEVGRTAYPWYAIRTRPRFEKTVAVGLRGKGYEEFLPIRRVRKAKSDRSIVVEHPLFPGYMFCRFDSIKCLPILTTPGVIYIVSSSKRLLPVPDEEIASLRKVIQSPLDIQDSSYMAGAKVRITQGPLIGVVGTVTRAKHNYRVVVSISMLQRSVAVEIADDCLTVEALSSTSALWEN